jgi:hypothetical protein
MPEDQQNNSQEQNQPQSTNSTKRSIVIKPQNQQEIEDLIYITQYPGGGKFRDALSRIARKYNFTERDYKRARISIAIDFSAYNQAIEQQEKQNSVGI